MEGCAHYQRFCEVKAPCCNTYYRCRKCHDEIVIDHEMDTFKVTEIRCLYCKTEQPVSNQCITCEKQMAKYYCAICHLFENDETKSIFHCVECGFCYLAEPGAEIKHCSQCNMCRDVDHTTHIDCNVNCPICMESTQGYRIVRPACDHLIHEHCHDSYVSQDNYKCPICSRTYAHLNMDLTWRNMDRMIELQPMPDEYKNTSVNVLCNDCQIRKTHSLNLIGYKCNQCGGYNTVTV